MSSETGASWDVTAIDRRLDFSDFLGPAFDSSGQACRRRIFLFATPRSASWTACRYLTAAGWGVATEYFFGDQVVNLARRLLGRGAVETLRYDDLGRFRIALEDSRSRNGIFSSKVFWHEFQRVRRAYSEDMLQSASHLFLYRRDFAAQVVSMAVGLQSLRLSFSEQTLDLGHVQGDVALREADGAALLRRCAEQLLKSERAWFDEFRRRGWRPQVIESEAMIDAPLRMFETLGPRLGLHFDAANVMKCHQFEHDARYAPGAIGKRQLATDHAGLLADYAQRRAEQYARLGADVVSM